MKKVLLTVCLSLLSLTASAELKTADKVLIKEKEAKITTRVAAMAKECGCSPKVTVDWASLKSTLSNADQAFDQGPDCAANLEAQASMFCDKDFKAAFCSKVGNIHIVGGKEAKLALAGKKLTATVAGNGCNSFADFLKKEL